MSIFQAVILGLVQGFAEFLPISSSGHLVIVQNIFGMEENMMAFDVLLHIGTLIPVLIVFWQEIFALIKNPFQKMTLMLIIGTLPAVVLTLLFGDFIDSLFAGGIFLALGYIITGVLLLSTDKLIDGRRNSDDMKAKDALIIGVIQGIAIMPGISRSGSTITGALFRGFDKSAAASFSFLLSIPAIGGAAVLHLKDVLTGESILSTMDFSVAAAGFIASMVSGYIAIKFMLNLIKNRKLKYFAYYVFALAAFIIVDICFLGKVF